MAISDANATSTNAEVDKLLNTFGDTIPQEFKASLLKRVPSVFEIKPDKKVTEQSVFSRTPTADQRTQPGQAASVAPDIQALLDKYAPQRQQ